MIVLSKKRIIFLISAIMVSFLVILANGVVYGEEKHSGFTVILDAGHGNPDGRSCER